MSNLEDYPHPELGWVAWVVEASEEGVTEYLTVRGDGDIAWSPAIDDALQFKQKASAEKFLRAFPNARVTQHQWGFTDQLHRPPNACDGIFDHKYLNPVCVTEGCKNLFLVEALEKLEKLNKALDQAIECGNLSLSYESSDRPIFAGIGAYEEIVSRSSKCPELAEVLDARQNPPADPQPATRGRTA